MGSAVQKKQNQGDGHLLIYKVSLKLYLVQVSALLIWVQFVNMALSEGLCTQSGKIKVVFPTVATAFLLCPDTFSRVWHYNITHCMHKMQTIMFVHV